MAIARRRSAPLALVLVLGGLATTASCSSTSAPDPPPGDRSATDLHVETRPALPEPRTEVAGVRWGQRLVVVGGLRADGRATSRADVFDLVANRWSDGPALPVALHHAGVAVVGDRAWVVGGYSGPPGGPWVEQSAVYSLGAGEGSWRAEPALPAASGALAVAASGDTLVAFGGVRAGRPHGDVWVLPPGADRWEVGPPLRQAREHLAGAALGGRVYAIAGRVGGLDTNLASVESWAPGEPAWRAEPDLRHARGGTAASVIRDFVCVAGGEEPDGTIAGVECLRDGRWQRMTDLRVPRHGVAVMGFGDFLHVVGGGPEPGLTVSGAHEAVAFNLPLPQPDFHVRTARPDARF